MSNLTEIKKHLVSHEMASQFKMALPKAITAEKFQRVALTALLHNPDIQHCSTSSVMKSLLLCAQDGLLPDGREAALVKFNPKGGQSVAQYMPMVYGLIKRMRNSGSVTNVNAYCVYENDIFDYQIKNGVESISHRPCITGPRGDFLLAYAVVGLEDSNPHIEVMVKEEIEKARRSSPNQRNSEKPTGIWEKWYDEMAKKTVLHRASKRVPTSAEALNFLDNDMRVTLNGGFDEPEPEPQKTLVNSINDAIDLEPLAQEIEQEVVYQTSGGTIDASDDDTYVPPIDDSDLFPNS